MDEITFKARTKKLAVAIIRQVDKLPRSLATDVIAKQLVGQVHPLVRTIVPHVVQSQHLI